MIFNSNNDLTPEEWDIDPDSTTELLPGNVLQLGARNIVFFGQFPSSAARELGTFSNDDLKGTYNLTADVYNSNNQLPVTATIKWRRVFSYETVAEQTVDPDPPTGPGLWNIGQINLDFTFPEYEFGAGVQILFTAPDAIVTPAETFGYVRNILITRTG